MSDAIQNSMLKVLQKEFVRRNMIKYFEEKGYDNFLVKPYPPTLMDINERVDILNGLIEVSYFLEDIDMANNNVKVGWNVFLLGNKRIFLGYTIHNNLSEIDHSRNASNIEHDGPINIKSITETIVEMLGESERIKDIYKAAAAYDSGNPMIDNDVVKPEKPVPDLRRRV